MENTLNILVKKKKKKKKTWTLILIKYRFFDHQRLT